jgi:hypothetical protein
LKILKFEEKMRKKPKIVRGIEGKSVIKTFANLPREASQRSPKSFFLVSRQCE